MTRYAVQLHSPLYLRRYYTLQMGYVAELIIWLAGHSQLLAHQLIWNMETNMYTDEDSKNKDPVLYDALSEIIKKVGSY